MKTLNTVNRGGSFVDRQPKKSIHNNRKGAMGTVDVSEATHAYAGDSLLGIGSGRKKVKKDAKAAKQVRKASAPTKKELKASKKTSIQSRKDNKSTGKLSMKTAKASKKTDAGTTKVNRSEASKSLADKGIDSKAKVLETVNAGINAAATVLGGGEKPAAAPVESEVIPPLSDKQSTDEKSSSGFNWLSWYMLLIYAVVLGLIIYFSFFRNKN